MSAIKKKVKPAPTPETQPPKAPAPSHAGEAVGVPTFMQLPLMAAQGMLNSFKQIDELMSIKGDVMRGQMNLVMPPAGNITLVKSMLNVMANTLAQFASQAIQDHRAKLANDESNEADLGQQVLQHIT